jgi:hypothetical protein
MHLHYQHQSSLGYVENPFLIVLNTCFKKSKPGLCFTQADVLSKTSIQTRLVNKPNKSKKVHFTKRTARDPEKTKVLNTNQLNKIQKRAQVRIQIYQMKFPRVLCSAKPGLND